MKVLMWPLLTQVFLTFILLFRMAYMRLKAIKNGEVKIKDIALGQNAWPENATKAENSFHNQFEMPILFYVAIIYAQFLQLNSTLFLILSWVFVVSRIFHSIIHSRSNRIPLRFRLFVIGVISLLIQWAYLGLVMISN